MKCAVCGAGSTTCYCRHAAGTPDEAIDRWRVLLRRCRNDRNWYAAR